MANKFGTDSIVRIFLTASSHPIPESKRSLTDELELGLIYLIFVKFQSLCVSYLADLLKLLDLSEAISASIGLSPLLRLIFPSIYLSHKIFELLFLSMVPLDKIFCILTDFCKTSYWKLITLTGTLFYSSLGKLIISSPRIGEFYYLFYVINFGLGES